MLVNRRKPIYRTVKITVIVSSLVIERATTLGSPMRGLDVRLRDFIYEGECSIKFLCRLVISESSISFFVKETEMMSFPIYVNRGPPLVIEARPMNASVPTDIILLDSAVLFVLRSGAESNVFTTVI